MATNSVLARATAGGGFEGVVCNFDGDPQRMGHWLWDLVHKAAGGAEGAAQALVDEHGGWSAIRPGADAEWLREQGRELPEESVLVPGWGIAYSDLGAEHRVRGRDGERLEMGRAGFRPEWVYALAPEAGQMDVYQVAAGVARKVAEVNLAGAEPDWGDIECGPNLERCGHAVYVHAERFGIDPKHPSARMDIAQFTGDKPLEEWLAIGATYQGKSYEFTGNGRRGQDGHWHQEARVGVNASRVWLDMDQPGVRRVYPKRRQELLDAGELELAPAVELVAGGMVG